MNILQDLKTRLSERALRGNLRALKNWAHPIDLASNDYLGLSRSRLLHEAILKEDIPKIGSTGSRLLTGNSSYVENLENSIARFHGSEAGLIYGSGYLANLGLISSITKPRDTILFDIKVHASTHDGMHLSQATAYPFYHNDLSHLEQRLKNTSAQGNRFVCIESVYSTDGSIAPLVDICKLCEHYDAALIVDEAHSVGVFGKEGRGLIVELQLEKYVFAQVITFGKALGAYGAIVLGRQLLKDFLINFSRSCIYTTALPFHVLAAIKCAYELLPKLNEERAQLYQLISHFQKTFSSRIPSPIQPIKIKDPDIRNQFHQNGFDVRMLKAPTVHPREECARICLHSYNTIEEISNFRELFKEPNA